MRVGRVGRGGRSIHDSHGKELYMNVHVEYYMYSAIMRLTVYRIIRLIGATHY